MSPTLPSPHPHLRIERDDAVLTVSLANPDRRNAQTPSLWLAFAQLALELDPQVRVVVLRADGPSFSAGLDRRMLSPTPPADEPSFVELGTADPDDAAATVAELQRGFTCWTQVSAVVVAAVQGHAIGAGFQLALAADLRVVAADVQLAMRETSLGLVPDLAGLTPLVQCVGVSRALEICATGRAVGAAEAVATGLANLAVPADELGAATDDLVTALLSAPDAALRALKPLVRSAASVDLETQTRLEREAQVRLLAGLVRDAGV